MPKALVTVMAVALMAVSCSGAPSDAPGGVRVVATTSIIGDLVEDLVGADGTVEVLIESGQDPHGFAVSARQSQSLREADLVVANGLGLEAHLVDLLDELRAERGTVLEISGSVEVLAGDPHVWLDPRRMADAVQAIARGLAEVDDHLDDAEWTARGIALAARLGELDHDVAALLAAVPPLCRELITNHDSLGYLADRYDFEIIATVIPGNTTQVAPSARDFADLVELMQERAAVAIFAETTASTDLAAALADELEHDVAVVELNTGSLGPPGSAADSYEGMMLQNAALIADALVGC